MSQSNIHYYSLKLFHINLNSPKQQTNTRREKNPITVIIFIHIRRQWLRECTWNSQAMWLLHEIDKFRFVFSASNHYFCRALASNVVETQHPPLISKHPQIPSSITISTRMHLLTPLLQPPFHSWPMHSTLKKNMLTKTKHTMFHCQNNHAENANRYEDKNE